MSHYYVCLSARGELFENTLSEKVRSELICDFSRECIMSESNWCFYFQFSWTAEQHDVQEQLHLYYAKI